MGNSNGHLDFSGNGGFTAALAMHITADWKFGKHSTFYIKKEKSRISSHDRIFRSEIKHSIHYSHLPNRYRNSSNKPQGAYLQK